MLSLLLYDDVKAGESSMSSGPETSMLYAACESLWRDVKYSAMERGYEVEQALQKELQTARRNPVALREWLQHLAEVEETPKTLSGIRNTLFHVYGYWKDSLTSEDRHAWHEEIIHHPGRARNRIQELIIAYPNAYLVTSYYWRDDSWTQSWFRYQGHWWKFQVMNGQSSEWKLFSVDEVISGRVGGTNHMAFDVEFLHRNRLAVKFPTGEHLLYPWFLPVTSDL